jgi:hypothetical protein
MRGTTRSCFHPRHGLSTSTSTRRHHIRLVLTWLRVVLLVPPQFPSSLRFCMAGMGDAAFFVRTDLAVPENTMNDCRDRCGGGQGKKGV